MNWLGEIVAAHVRPTDAVLDLGCGIMPATGGRLKVRLHVGVDSFKPYLDKIGEPTVLGRLPRAIEAVPPGSFDVVLMLDVIEHMSKPNALATIKHAERIARREVILFTPDGRCPQKPYDAWDMGVNQDMAHRCEFTFDELVGLGYECRRYPNATKQQGPITSVLGVKVVHP